MTSQQVHGSMAMGGPPALVPTNRTVSLYLLLLLLFLTGASTGSVPPALADEAPLAPPDREALTARDAISPLRQMQRFISKADGDRCPMYPTCSHYAYQAFAREGVLLGWILTCDRLLRCGRDEKRLAAPIRIQGQKYVYDPLDANTFWWKAR